MGDPKFSRKTYDTPSHPWQGERIKAEVEVVRAFGLKNKTEVWKAETILRNWGSSSAFLATIWATLLPTPVMLCSPTTVFF